VSGTIPGRFALPAFLLRGRAMLIPMGRGLKSRRIIFNQNQCATTIFQIPTRICGKQHQSWLKVYGMYFCIFARILSLFMYMGRNPTNSIGDETLDKLFFVFFFYSSPLFRRTVIFSRVASLPSRNHHPFKTQIFKMFK